jgi:hypothetical protein
VGAERYSAAAASRHEGNLYEPQPIPVRCSVDGLPLIVGGSRVDALREEWLVEDRWWTPAPIRRRYFELVLADGRNLVIFCELGGSGRQSTRRWFQQRA